MSNITCITASDDEDAASLVGEVLLGKRRSADEEALTECVEVGSHGLWYSVRCMVMGCFTWMRL